MKKLSNWLYSICSTKLVIISIIIFIIFMVGVLPIVSNYTAKITGGSESPDTSIIYKADDLYKMAHDYGVMGRKAYIVLRFTFDLLWPLAYLFFMVAVISKLLSWAVAENSKLRYLNLLPFLGALFDYLENIGASIVVGRYPLKTAVIAELTPIMTLLKWIFISGGFIVLIALLLYHGYKLIVRIISDKR